MIQRRPSSLLWPTLAVLLPLILLAALAALGTRSQLNAAWAEARAEAERLAPVTAGSLEQELKAGLDEIPRYPAPPVPGTASPKDDILDGSDVTALAALRDEPDAGISPAGLPRRVLAALAILRLAPAEPINRPVLIELFTRDAPSILSSLALETIAADEVTRQRWRADETIRSLAPNLEPNGEIWVERDGHFIYLKDNGGTLESTKIPTARLNLDGQLPTWARADVSLGSSKTDQRVLASAPVDLGTGLAVHISAVADLIEAPVRFQQRWTFAILAASFLTAAIALTVLHRTLRRERQLNEMKSQFVASVSHELRAPVASIRLMAEALEAGKIEHGAVKDFHRLIAREGARLSTLVGNVLDHSRIEQGRRIWKMEPTDLAALVSDTLRVMDTLAREKDITLASDLPALEANVDPGAIQQALVNLLDNAIKFSAPGTTVTTSLSNAEESQSWQLTVRDQGCGIPKNELSRIFERFYRPGDELRRETQGTGIGLSLVKAIAEAHGGSVRVESEVGAGSAFILQIPFSS